MLINRSIIHNIQFHDTTSGGVASGGLIQNGSVAEANFLDILGVLLITERSIAMVGAYVYVYVAWFLIAVNNRQQWAMGGSFNLS